MQGVTLLMFLLRIFTNARYVGKTGDCPVAFLLKNCYYNNSEKKSFYQMLLWKIDSYSLLLCNF